MRVFNKRIRIVKETLNIRFLENSPNVKGNGPDWLFDFDSLKISMNYVSIVAGFQTNDIAETKDNIVAGQAKKKKEPEQEYILIPICITDPIISQGPKDGAVDAGKKAIKVHKSQVSDNGEQDDQVTRSEFEGLLQQERQTEHINSTNSFNTVSSSVNTAGPSFVNVALPSPINVVGTPISINAFKEHHFERFSLFKNAFSLPHVPIVTLINDTKIFGNAYDDKAVEEEVDMNNVVSSYTILDAPLTKFLKDHLKDQVIGSIETHVQTRQMTKINEEHGLISSVQKLRRINHKDFQNYLFSCYLSQMEPKKPVQAVKDPSWVKATQDELLQNKKDERGIVIKNKARLVTQGHTQEEGIDYDEVFSLVERIEAIRLFLAYASFKDFVVYQIDVKSAFLYGKIKEEVYVYQPPGFEDPDFPDKVYKTASTPIEPNKALVKDAEAKDTSHLHVVKRIFRYLKGQPKSSLWYPKDSPFYLEAYSYSDYVGASIERKSTIGGSQFFGKRLISWQCKNQTIVAKSTTEAEYAIASCCGHVLWIQNQMFDYGFNLMNTKIYIDNENETVYKEWEGRMEKGATAASSLEIEQDSVFLDKQVEGMAKHKEIYVISSHTKKIFANMRRQGHGFSGNVTPLFETMMVNAQEEVGEAEVHLPSSEIHVKESIPTPSNDPLPSGEDSIQLNELMILCTNLQQQVLDLEEAKIAQAKEIAKLKKIVKKLEKRKTSRPAGLRKLKKGRMHDEDMFEVDDLEGNEVFVDVREEIIEKEVSTADLVTTAGEVGTAASVEDSVALTITTTADIDYELTLEKTLIAIKAAKPKVISTAITKPRAKGIVFHEQVQAHIPTVFLSNDKVKSNMIEPEKPLKKKDQIALNEEMARKSEAEIRAKIEEEERIAREKDEANIAMVKK
nr:hypothetical protein [Tanacetum cinerariifolium]